MSVVHIRFVRSSEIVNYDDEKEAKGSLHFREEQMKDQIRGIGIGNKNNSYFYKKKLSNYMIFTK